MASASASPQDHLSDAEYTCLAWQVHRAMLSADVASGERERVAGGASDRCRRVPCLAWQVHCAALDAGVVGGERERAASGVRHVQLMVAE